MLKKTQYIIGLVFLIFTILLVGCSDKPLVGEINPENKQEEVVNLETEKKEKPQESEKLQEPEKPKVDLAQIKANELGEIMVLMYHSIGEPEGEFRRTPENFKQDLEHLYANDYRPISLVDYVTGNITTEAGFTPIVLTFDDGWQDNFNVNQDQQGNLEVDPNSAVGILTEFHKKHSDFPLEATFFVNDNIPFGQKEHLEYKLNYIVENGMDIGNHTATHIDFKRSNPDAEKIQKEIATIVNMVNSYVPQYSVNTLSLPFGARPKDESLYTNLEQGSFAGTTYKNLAILNVGWDPYKSPYHPDFNPLAIHRVRASDLQKYVQGVGMYDWLKRYEKGQRTRYISDGDPDVVAVPVKYADKIDQDKLGSRELKTYE